MNGAILNKTESRTIFGNLPDILSLHEMIVKDIQEKVDEIIIGKNLRKREESSIGWCMLKHSENIREKYRSYIGFMDQSKREREYQKGKLLTNIMTRKRLFGVILYF